MDDPLFLSQEAVLLFHARQLELFGGQAGVRDFGLLESAVAQPQTRWCYDLDADVFDLAAAYTFHLVKNHPFIDGNKRVALHAGLAFLEVNGISLTADQNEMYDAVIRLATSESSKDDFTSFLRKLHRPS